MRARSDWFLSDSSGLVTVRVRSVQGDSSTWMAGPCRFSVSLAVVPVRKVSSGMLYYLDGWSMPPPLGIFCLSGPRHCADQVSSGILLYLDGWSMPPSVFSVSLALVTVRIKSVDDALHLHTGLCLGQYSVLYNVVSYSLLFYKSDISGPMD